MMASDEFSLTTIAPLAPLRRIPQILLLIPDPTCIGILMVSIPCNTNFIKWWTNLYEKLFVGHLEIRYLNNMTCIRRLFALIVQALWIEMAKRIASLLIEMTEEITNACHMVMIRI